MPIDFTQLYAAVGTKTGSRNAELGGSQQPVDALAKLGLRQGETYSAQVLTVKSIKPEHQQWLSREQPASIPPAPVKTPEAQAALRLATLLIKGQSLPAITRETLQPGQTVAVALSPNRQLLLNPQNLNAHSTAASTQPPPPASTPARRPAPSPEVLSQALREVLPRQAAPRLEPLAQALTRLFQQLPQSAGTPALVQGLQQVAKSPIPLQPGQIIEPATLKSAVENSGSLFEKNFLAAKAASPETVQQVLSVDRKAGLLQLAKQLATQLPPPPGGSGAAGATNTAPQAVFAPRESADVAVIARILAGVSATQQAASATATGQASAASKVPAQGPTLTADSAALKAEPLNLTQLFLNHQRVPSEASEARVLRTQLMLLTHQLTLNSIARIRQQQLQPEASRARTGEAPSGINVHVDLPVRIDQAVYPIKIAIQEQPEPEAEKKTARKSKRWQVTLALETPDAGSIYARLGYINQVLDIIFWGENQRVLQQAKTQFSDYVKPLAAAGLEVKSVQFLEGAPPTEGNTLAYNLVDIST